MPRKPTPIPRRQDPVRRPPPLAPRLGPLGGAAVLVLAGWVALEAANGCRSEEPAPPLPPEPAEARAAAPSTPGSSLEGRGGPGGETGPSGATPATDATEGAIAPRSAAAGGGEAAAAGASSSSGRSAPVPAGAPAWTPPIGIPEPSFGVRVVAPPRPEPWDEERPGFYYVDMHDPAASDARERGTPAAPRATIPETLAAGDVVEVHGAYDHAPMGYSRVGGAGTPERPIFIRGRDAATRPTFRRDLHVTGSYMILENLAFADRDGTLAGQPAITAPAHHVALRDCDVSGNRKTGGVLVVSWSGERGHDIVLLRNVIHDNGDWKATFDQDRHGIALGDVDNVWICDNELTRNSGDGLQINAGTQADQSRTHHIYVGRNRAHENKQSGLWTKQAVDVVFSQNRVWGHRPSDSSPGGGMGWQYAPERVWFIFNEVFDCEMGIYAGSDSGLGTGESAWIVGNVIHDIHHSGAKAQKDSAWAPAAITVAGGRRVAIVDNTIYDVDAGIHSPLHEAALLIEGNILSRVTLGAHIFLEDRGTARASRLARNLLEGPVRVRWGGGAARTIAGLRMGGGAQESGTIEAAPRFRDPGKGDFRLREDSPAIDAGAAADVYAAYKARYGIDIAVDFGGAERPRGDGWDLGAIESR